MRVARRKWQFIAALRATLHVSAGALCHGGTSESVRMLREMAIEEVGQELALGCYILVC